MPRLFAFDEMDAAYAKLVIVHTIDNNCANMNTLGQIMRKEF